MKKNYFTFLLLSISFLTYAQGPEFTIDFEGTDPLNNLPSGVTSVNPPDLFDSTPKTDSIVAFLNKNAYTVLSAGADLAQIPESLFMQRNQFDNEIKEVSGNKLLQTDFTGHIVIDETALGTGSYSIRLNLSVYGHTMQSTDCGIFTVIGNNGGTWEADRFTSRNGGFATGFGDSGGVGGAAGFQYGTVTPPYREIVVTYNDVDKLYRIYIEGVLLIISDEAQTSGDWTDRKFYIGFNGQNSPKTTGDEHLDSATGEFTSNGVRGDGRVADLQMRMDNIQVYKRAISDADVTTLFNGGSLSANTQTKETFNSFPNPVNDRLYFSSKNVNSVEIYNLLGSKVSSQVVTDGVDMSNLNKGLYLIKIKDASGLELGTIKTVKK